MTNRKAKLIAFYLPQFHPTPENDKWWGKGFTDWTNVKQAKPLYDGHIQPKKPHPDIGYYDPTFPGILEKQAEMANQYGINGFCFYHYWFSGKILLEKPLERLARNPQIDLPFCICWANEPWTRAWDGKEKDVLMPQRYGDEREWKRHFDYLLPYFKDARAICVEGKPLFLIYRIGNIDRVNEMILYWRRLSEKAGLLGLHVVSMLTGFSDSSDLENAEIDAVCEFQPNYALKPKFTDIFGPALKIGVHHRALRKLLGPSLKTITKINYDNLWKRILSTKKVFPVQYRGAFVSWDNSPRKGASGIIIEGSTPERFQYWLNKQAIRAVSDKQQEPLIFLNAWNEWAEGAYLEPDTTEGYSYLDIIRSGWKT